MPGPARLPDAEPAPDSDRRGHRARRRSIALAWLLAWTCLLGFPSGCVHGGTGPVLGISSAGPVVGWEGSAGYGPVQATAGGSLRPLGGERWGSLYAGLEPAGAIPFTAKDPRAALGIGVSGGAHLSSGNPGGFGLYGGGWGAFTQTLDGQHACEGQLHPTASLSLGVRFLVGSDPASGWLWEGYMAPKFGFVGNCEGLDLGLTRF